MVLIIRGELSLHLSNLFRTRTSDQFSDRRKDGEGIWADVRNRNYGDE